MLTWHNSVAIHDPAKDVAKAKQQDGLVLLTQGSTVWLQDGSSPAELARREKMKNEG